MNTKTRRVTRDLDAAELPWLAEGEKIEAGTLVWLWRGETHGCIGDGIAVTTAPDTPPFVEVPADALEPIVLTVAGEGALAGALAALGFPMAEPSGEPMMVVRPCGCTSMVTGDGDPVQVSWCDEHDPGYEQV